MTPRRHPGRRFLGHEFLEGRNLLAGMISGEEGSAFQNPLDANDLNADGAVSAADALAAINSLNSGAAGDLGATFAPPTLHGIVHDAAADYLDATGDGYLSAGDALAVINAINGGLTQGPIRSLPLSEDQGDTVETAATLALGRNFAKALGAIDPAGDVDIFKFTPTKSQLNVAVFSARGVPLQVTIMSADEGELEAVETAADSRRPVRLNVAVEVNKEYFISVRAAATAAPGATGVYGVGVFNYSDDQFRPVTDSELGDDQHDDLNGSPTPLELNGNRTVVRSNIDSAQDEDAFTLELTGGKLIVTTSASFPLLITLEPADPLLATTSGEHKVIANVAAGTYQVSVKAADGTATGPYSLRIMHLPLDGTLPGPPQSALEALFARLDADDDGEITKTEVVPAVPPLTIPVLDRVFDNWDDDSSGTLNFTEFADGFDDLHERAAVHQPLRDFVNRVRRR